MAGLNQPLAQRRIRVRSELFAIEAFCATVVVLIVAPFLANADVLHSYIPFLLLRTWLIGFAIYGVALARGAGGARKAWILPYALMGGVFLLVWGLEVEQWAMIDFAFAAMVALSALFLRTEPAPPSKPRAA